MARKEKGEEFVSEIQARAAFRMAPPAAAPALELAEGEYEFGQFVQGTMLEQTLTQTAKKK